MNSSVIRVNKLTVTFLNNIDINYKMISLYKFIDIKIALFPDEYVEQIFI